MDLVLAFDGAKHPQQRRVMESLPNSIILLVRNFWDLGFCPESATVLDAGGFRMVQIDALSELLSCPEPLVGLQRSGR